MINAAWFVVLVGMLAGYAALDGFDLGVGALHLLLPRDARERDLAINAIGPVWNGNEVWLIAAAGAMVAAFPVVYAAAFSGFYLALMLVLWLLVFRGLGIEFRHQLDHPMWRQAWDVAFSAASALLAVLFGVAFGNVLRGLPLDESGTFAGTFALMLNPFAALGGLLSLAMLSLHGSAYLAMKTTGPLQQRAHRWIGPLWAGVVVLTVALVAASFGVRPDFTDNFFRWPALALIPLATVTTLASVPRLSHRGSDRSVFLASATTIIGLIASAAAGLFPRLLPTRYGSAFAGLDIYNAASPASSLRIALAIYLIGLAIVIVYMTHAYRVWGGRVTAEHEYKL